MSKVKVIMENHGEFTIELYPEFAPATVANFLKLAGSGFYDGTIFHRVVDNFMAQGGDPEGTGMGGADETIKGEFAANGFTQNTLSHTRGVISMARANNPNSASSQFFIMHEANDSLDGKYAAFGKVTEGMETADAIVSVPRDRYNDKPFEDQKMKSVRVETFGETYTVEKIKSNRF